MKIVVLGSASGMAVPQRNPSAYLLETQHRLYLIDAGEGVSQQLVRCQTDPNRIDTAFISHTHPDHVTGLFALLQNMHLTSRKKPLRIYLPQGVLPDFEAIFPYFQIFRDKWPFRFEFMPIKPGLILEESGLRVSAIPNDHLSGNRESEKKQDVGSDSYSFYIAEKQIGTWIYTSDVDGLSHLKEAAQGVDLLISECTHVSIEEVCEFARARRIGRVVLTHIPPELEHIAHAGKFDCGTPVVDFAHDGYTIEV